MLLSSLILLFNFFFLQMRTLKTMKQAVVAEHYKDCIEMQMNHLPLRNKLSVSIVTQHTNIMLMFRAHPSCNDLHSFVETIDGY